MDIHTTDDKRTSEGISIPPRTEFAPDALPEVQTPIQVANSQTGVSTNYIQSATEQQSSNKDSKGKNTNAHWYALRATYGQAGKANDYLVSQGVETYYPTIKAFVMVKNKRKKVTKSYLFNIFFAYGTEDVLKKYVYDNANLPYLRFYYGRKTVGREVQHTPLIVPEYQLDNLRTVLADQSGELVIVPNGEKKFELGTPVRVIGGTFKGIVGKVARYCGQQRVAIVVDGFLTIATTYIPTAYLERID